MENSVFDGDVLIKKIHLQNHGKPRIEMLKDAIVKADQAGDSYWRMYMRFDYITEQYFHGDAAKCIPVVQELESVFKENPAAVERYEGDDLGKEAYLMAVELGVDTIACLPQVSLEEWDKLLDEYYKLIKQFGMKERSYYWQVFWKWLYIDLNKAEEVFKKIWETEPDSRFDCEACEHSYAARLYLEMGQKEKADTYAEKIEKDLLDKTCEGAQANIWSFYLKYALYNKDIQMARPYARKLYRKHNKDQGDLEDMGQVLQYYAYKNTARGLKLFKERIEWTKGMWNQRSKFYFYTGSWALFKELAKDNNTINIDLSKKAFELWKEEGIYETAVLADWFYKKALEIAESFDNRNGSSYYTEYLKSV